MSIPAWLPLALACALFTAVSDTLSKQILKADNEYLVALVRVGGCAVILGSLLLWRGWQVPQEGFWLTILLIAPMDVVGSLLLNRALRLSPLYLTVPFLALTPVFMLAAAWLFLKEAPSALGLAGILLVALGGYVLQVSKAREGLWAPVRAVFSEPGARLMLFVSALFALSGTLGRKAVLLSEPFTMSGLYYPLVFAGLLPVAGPRASLRFREALSTRLLLLGLAVSESLSILTHFTAIHMTQAPAMISVKRLSTVLAVFFGWAFLRESRPAEHLLGTGLMVAGVFLIARG